MEQKVVKTQDRYIRGAGDFVVVIATGYGMDDIGTGVRVPLGARSFFSPCCP
jgi:hypothetical protein